MSIKARYENGIFRPLEEVRAKEGTIADVYLPGEKPEDGKKRPKSVRDFGFCGMWAGREDIGTGEEYVNRIRKYRREPERKYLSAEEVKGILQREIDQDRKKKRK